MKNLCFAILVFMAYSRPSFVLAQQWYSSQPTAGFDINTVAIPGQGHIAIGGGRESDDSIQIMFRSSDFGQTWNENAHDGPGSWNKSITFADSVYGIGVGYEGRIIRSNDGGANWGYDAFPVNRDFNKIVYAGNQTYFIAGGNRSDDSVQTILKTTDGGDNWTVVLDQPGPWLKTIWFTDTLTGFAAGDSGVLLTTTTGGSSWSVVVLPVQRDWNAVTFVNADTGFIVGGNASQRTILRTYNGGINWAVVLDAAGGLLNDVSFANPLTGYAVGDSATVLKTTDGGTNWLPVTVDVNFTGDEQIRAVKFYNSDFGVIGGKGGLLYVYGGWPIDFFTLNAQVIDSATVDVFASINTHGLPVGTRFTYSHDSTFSSYSYSPLQYITTDTFFPCHARITSLMPDTWYYYFIGNGFKTGDTLSFYTGSESPAFKTIAGDVIDSVTLRLKGEIHGYNAVSNLRFEYGAMPYLGNTITAVPSSVSDTALYNITATLPGIQPRTLYYYRMVGEAAGDTVYGNICFTGNPYHTLETLSAEISNDTVGTLNGVEQGFPGPVDLSFEYGLAQGPVNETPSQHFPNSDSLHYVSHFISGLQPKQLYYYRLKAESGIGISYGTLLAFFTGNQDSAVQTLPAQFVTSTSAMLQGTVNHLPAGSAVFFEYGTDSTVANSLVGTPAVTTDSLYRLVNALLTGVATNTMYYYRIKIVTVAGAVFYGKTRVVYIGDNEIPNWDFQNWQTITYQVPAGWNIGNKQFNRVPGHSGNYALNLTGINLAIMGFPSEDKTAGQGLNLLGGMPFTGRPDSLTFYIKGSQAAGDSVAIILYLHKGSIKIAKNIFKISGNTGGVFKRVSLPVSYQSSLMPDSLVLGFTSVNPDYPTPGNLNNNVTVDDFAFVPPVSPVYNGNFETWFDYSLTLPDSWYAPTFLSLDSTNTTPVPMVSKAVYYAPDDYAAQLKTMNLGSLGLLGGNLGLKSYAFYGETVPAFAVHTGHHTLNGFYEAYPVNGDTMSINVFMYYAGQPVGYGKLEITDSVNQFTPFEVPILYLPDSLGIVINTPDSADILMSTSSLQTRKARGVSKLLVDKLRFDGFTADAGDHFTRPSYFDENGVKVYPNPSDNVMTLELLSPVSSESFIQLYNLSGQLQKEISMPAGTEKISFGVADMNAGLYLLRWLNGNNPVNKRIIVVK